MRGEIKEVEIVSIGSSLGDFFFFFWQVEQKNRVEIRRGMCSLERALNHERNCGLLNAPETDLTVSELTQPERLTCRKTKM